MLFGKLIFVKVTVIFSEKHFLGQINLAVYLSYSVAFKPFSGVLLPQATVVFSSFHLFLVYPSLCYWPLCNYFLCTEDIINLYILIKSPGPAPFPLKYIV